MDFKDDKTLNLDQESSYFLTEQAAEEYNDFAAEHDDCSEINKDQFILKITQTYIFDFDFADCDLGYCEQSDTDCFSYETQKKLCDFEKIDINLFGDCEDLPNSLFQDVEFRESCMILDLIPETDGFDWVFLKIGKSPSPSPSPSSSPSPSPSPSLFSSSSSSPSPSPSSSPSPAPSSSPSPSSCTSSSSPFWIYLLMFGAGAIVGCFLVLFVFLVLMKREKEPKHPHYDLF